MSSGEHGAVSSGCGVLAPDGLRARRFRTGRTIVALVLREMATSYGRNPGGYLWAVIEPALALAMLSLVFSIALSHPPLGVNFPLFYATGYLPFMLFNDIANKSATALTYSRPLLNYPSVTFLDALLARAGLHFLTQVMVGFVIFTGLDLVFSLRLNPGFGPILTAYGIGAALGIGTGMLNCFVMMTFPVWERIWQILTRPLILVSGLLVPYDTMPERAQALLWWNPLIHVTGFLRRGIYPQYRGDYLSALYPLAVAGGMAVLGLLLLRRHYARLLED